MKVCGETGAHATHCLDKCNGYAGLLPKSDGYKYRYYMTGPLSDLTTDPLSPVPDKSFFPFTPICLRGCCPENVINCPSVLPLCDAKAEAGTSDDFTPSYLNGVTVLDGVPTMAPTPAPSPVALNMPSGVSQACLSITGLMAGGKESWTCLDLPKACCNSYGTCNTMVDTLYSNKVINDALAASLVAYLVPRCYTGSHTETVKVVTTEAKDLTLANKIKEFELGGQLHKTIVVHRGHTYRFEQSDSSNKWQGLAFSSSPDGTFAKGGKELNDNWSPSAPSATPSPTSSVVPWRPTLAPTAFPTPFAVGTYHGNLRGSVAESRQKTGKVVKRVRFSGTPGKTGAYAELLFTSDLPSVMYYFSETKSGAGGRIVDKASVGDTSSGCTCQRNWKDSTGTTHATCAEPAGAGGIGGSGATASGQEDLGAWCYINLGVSPGCGVASQLTAGVRWDKCKSGWQTNVLAMDGISIPAGTLSAVDASIATSSGSNKDSSSGRILIDKVTGFVADMLAQIGVPFIELRGRQVQYGEEGHPVRSIRVFDTKNHAGFDSTDSVVVPKGSSSAPHLGGVVAMVKDHPYPSEHSLDLAAHGGKVEGHYDERTKVLHLHLLDRNEYYTAQVAMRRRLAELYSSAIHAGK